MYHTDGTDDHGSFVGLGRDFASHVVRRMRESTDATMHTIGNVRIDFDGPDAAHCESYVHAEQVRTIDGSPIIERFGGRYVDRFERRDGAWRIADRVVVHDWDQVEPLVRAFPAGKWMPGRRDRHDRSYLGRHG